MKAVDPLAIRERRAEVDRVGAVDREIRCGGPCLLVHCLDRYRYTRGTNPVTLKAEILFAYEVFVEFQRPIRFNSLHSVAE